MKINFSPEYSGTVWTGLTPSRDILMDTVTVDTERLVGLLELHAGIHHADCSQHRRIALYYKAMKRYMAEHPSNVLSRSFSLSGLGTAVAALTWRDSLLMAGWSAEQEAVSERIKVLCGVERHFDAEPSLAERMDMLTANLNADYRDYEIVIPCDSSLLHPRLQALLSALAKRGADIRRLQPSDDKQNNLSRVRRLLLSGSKERISLDASDRSLLIYRFANEVQAEEYLAHRGDEEGADLWINCANKSMDNWLRLMGKPATGSSADDSMPRVVQLFVLGIGLLHNPLNLTALIDWLYSPVHPLPSRLRYRLAESIIAEGGYRNDRCRELIRRYVDGELERKDESDLQPDEKPSEKKLERMKREREGLVKTYLPPLEKERKEDDHIDVQVLTRLVSGLRTWAEQRAVFIAEDASREQLAEGLLALSSMCQALMMIVEAEGAECLSYKLLDSWVSTIYTTKQFTQYAPQKGCRTVIGSPSKMAAKAKKVVWMNVDIEAGRQLDCDFLYPSEYAKAASQLTMYEHEQENRYISQMELTPFTMTEEQLILTLCDYRGGETPPTPPIMVRLEALIENLSEFVMRPTLRDELLKQDDAENTDNAMPHKQLEIENAHLIHWGDHIGPTTIDTFVQHPFDYVMENLVGINADGPSLLADVNTVKGNVAHAVIEHIFSPLEEKLTATPAEIEDRMGDYDTVVDDIIEAHGAILNHSENKLGAKQLKSQLRTCLNNLLRALRDNRLQVTACERKVNCDMELLGDKGADDMHSRIDMTAVDDRGKEVVIDFKWTSSRKYYQTLLKENRSVQLALYRRIMQEMGCDVHRTAYFLMPEGRLYSTSPFEGDMCVQLSSDNHDDIAVQMLNSFRYRKAQIDHGVIEMCENQSVDGLDYVTDTKANNLFPLKTDEEGKKETNMFSNYTSFNQIN